MVACASCLHRRCRRDAVIAATLAAALQNVMLTCAALEVDDQATWSDADALLTDCEEAMQSSERYFRSMSMLGEVRRSEDVLRHLVACEAGGHRFTCTSAGGSRKLQADYAGFWLNVTDTRLELCWCTPRICSLEDVASLSAWHFRHLLGASSDAHQGALAELASGELVTEEVLSPDRWGLDFVLLGFAKCGTHQLLASLRKHPRITIPENEHKFLWNGAFAKFQGEVDAMQSNLRLERPIRGLNNPAWIVSPSAMKLLRTAHRLKYIVLVRPPLERLESLANGSPPLRGSLDWDDVVQRTLAGAPIHPHADPNHGLYARRLEQDLLQYVSAGRVLVVSLSAFRERQQNEDEHGQRRGRRQHGLARVLEFLGESDADVAAAATAAPLVAISRKSDWPAPLCAPRAARALSFLAEFYREEHAAFRELVLRHGQLHRWDDLGPWQSPESYCQERSLDGRSPSSGRLIVVPDARAPVLEGLSCEAGFRGSSLETLSCDSGAQRLSLPGGGAWLRAQVCSPALPSALPPCFASRAACLSCCAEGGKCDVADGAGWRPSCCAAAVELPAWALNLAAEAPREAAPLPSAADGAAGTAADGGSARGDSPERGGAVAGGRDGGGK
eukprot:TRINITY_DN75786_c0_g1_i1.p1 TRINITY_DN75786_c0_g1~~TRINITY_DN75786_c0_g1_i1.p1  ORF type:complete len:617 (-),score=105.44 TRINITY_DN75786_c0_g1_i1:1-1851(-)